MGLWCCFGTTKEGRSKELSLVSGEKEVGSLSLSIIWVLRMND